MSNLVRKYKAETYTGEEHGASVLLIYLDDTLCQIHKEYHSGDRDVLFLKCPCCLNPTHVDFLFTVMVGATFTGHCPNCQLPYGVIYGPMSVPMVDPKALNEKII